jgi:hypothetical protein
VLNPPTDFVAHRDAVLEVARGFVDQGVEVVDVKYGYAASVELEIDITGSEPGKALVELFERLREDPRTRITVIDDYLDLSAEDRNGLEGSAPAS